MEGRGPEAEGRKGAANELSYEFAYCTSDLGYEFAYWTSDPA